VREEFLLASPRLTLPTLSPDALARGETRLRIDLDWGNDFGRDVPNFLVDGEHRTLALTLRRGASDRVTLGARLPLRWRGGGSLDHLIDAWHGVTNRLGLPDNGRALYLLDQFRVAWRRDDGTGVVWGAQAGTGLGKLELSGQWSALGGSASRSSLAVVGRAALPTGTGPFAGGGIEGGLQIVGARGLGRRLDGYLGIGGTLAAGGLQQGVDCVPARAHGFLALEWRPGRLWSLLAQVDGASRLVQDIRQYPALQSYVRFGAKRDVGTLWTAEAGFTENIKNQQSTTDFSIWLAFTRRLR
jgi:hypothetical protein